VRLSILPVADGDRIVCRLLEQGRNFSLKHSGFSLEDNHALRRLVAEGAGMVLLTGPTGSGKTSTHYALLSELNRVDVNIITIENPVEYVLPGISQVQVDEQQGRSFADALRSILRQDPDIVLVGEIRDAETARVASQAALTGHLVLSTLHTNDAMSTVPRLLDLGLDPSVLADALLGVVSQRLVRKGCTVCSHAPQDPLQPAESEFLRITGERPGVRVTGCAACGYTGYKGRVPIVEILSVSAGLRTALMNGIRDLRALREASHGHHSDMAHSAARWIVSGRTTPVEIQRVMGMRFWNALAALHGVEAGGSADLALSEAAGTGAFRLLMVSGDEALAQALGEVLPYAITRVDNVAAAGEALAQGEDLLGLLLDDAAMAGDARKWLVELRSQLAWSGLPALFLTHPGEGGLDETLDRFSAVHVDRSAPAPDIAETVMRVLRAVQDN
jgi:DNA polymerase III delta prime subunit